MTGVQTCALPISIDAGAASVVVERLAGELLSNPLIEAYEVEALGEAPDGAPATAGTAG